MISFLILITISILNARQLITANVLFEQRLLAYDQNGQQFAVICPSGSVVMSPEYFDRLADNIAFKNELIASGKIRPVKENNLKKIIYFDVKDGINSEPDAIIGGKLEYIF